MIRKASLLFAGALMGAGAVVGVTHPSLLAGSAAIAAAPETYRQLNLFGDVFERIRADYVEVPDEGLLIEAAINGMLQSLDPHSAFMNAEDFQDMQVQTRGAFGGLGIEVTMEEGIVKVVTPMDDSPAGKAGVLAGDLIVALDGEPVQGMSLDEAVERMRGEVNTPLVLTIRREGVERPLQITVVRQVIRLQSVRSRVEDDIAYIRITQFTEQTFDGLRNAIERTTAEIGDRLKGYVIDLRNNPGGLLDQSVAVSDAFLDQGEILSTRGRHPEETQRFNSRAGDLATGKPVIVLINGGSASASEIVAGALQDHLRATLVGTTTFGKGSVQTIIPLGAQSGALRMTTARYYTPSGRSIQATGIEPDIEVVQELPPELRDLVLGPQGEAGLRGHLSNEGEAERNASLAYIPPDPNDDQQLIYAFELLRGEEVNPAFPPGPAAAAAVVPN